MDIIEASIIIPCKNDFRNLEWTLQSILKAKNYVNFEIIIVDDGSLNCDITFLKALMEKYKFITLLRKRELGCAVAKNNGAAGAKGKYLFFLDAHVKVPDFWIDNLIAAMINSKAEAVTPGICDIADVNSVGYGETWTSKMELSWIKNKPKDIIEIPISCGCAFGIKREVFENIHGFDSFFRVWGREDEEISLKLWLFGYKLVVDPTVKIQHLFRSKFPYEVTTVNVGYNTLCMAYSHFKIERLQKTITVMQLNPYFKDIKRQIEGSFNALMTQRKGYLKERKYNDDYFFEKFNILY